jgi:hypothetical protein
MKEIWRGSDAFGASALYFQKTDDHNGQPATGMLDIYETSWLLQK